MRFPLAEPQRGKDLLIQANESFVSCDILVMLAPVLADGLVFTYPILLVRWYLRGVQNNNETYKYGALYVATSAAAVTIVAIIIQAFVDKQRPEGYIGNADMLIMDHLPTAPFPSDHASVGMAVAASTLLWAYKHDKKILQYIGRVLLVGSLLMSATRVGVGIHWPTDVLAGSMLGVIVARFLFQQGVWKHIQTYVYAPLVRLQNWIRQQLFTPKS